MDGQPTSEWPDFPFCSPRCRLVDLGRWLREDYRIARQSEGGAPAADDEADIP